MATRTTTATGNWNAGGTWVGGTPPGNGDLAIIASGHVVTVTANQIVGDSPAENGATRAIDFAAATSKLIVAAGIQLTVRGDVQMRGDGTVRDQWVNEAGSIVEFDASQAASPSSQNYRVLCAASNSHHAKFKCNGTLANPVTVRSNASGGNAYFTNNGFTNNGDADCTFTLFQRIGDGSNNAINAWPAGTGSAMFRFTDCVFDACGRVALASNPDANATVKLTRCTFKNSAHASESVNFAGGATTAISAFEDCSFDKAVDFSGNGGWSITGDDGCVFAAGWIIASNGALPTFKKFLNYVAAQAPQGHPSGTVEDGIFWKGAVANPHHASLAGNTAAIYRRMWFGYDGTSTVGDAVILNTATARTILFERCVVGANASGGQTGKMASLLGAGNTITVRRCTKVSGSTGAERGFIQFGETYAGADGEPAEITDSLAIDPSGSNATLLSRGTTNTTTLTNGANFHHNATFGGIAGGDGTGYDATSGTIFSGTAPGANDVVLGANPCVDIFRTIATWDASLGGAGTTANALAELAKRYDWTVSANPQYTLAALRKYLFGGAAVKDPAIANASSTGGVIGAGDFVKALLLPSVHPMLHLLVR